METQHFPGHQQALLKNKKCIVVLSFPEHDLEHMQETFTKFDYDTTLDLCELKIEGRLHWYWNSEEKVWYLPDLTD